MSRVENRTALVPLHGNIFTVTSHLYRKVRHLAAAHDRETGLYHMGSLPGHAGRHTQTAQWGT